MSKFISLIRDAISYCFAWLIIVITGLAFVLDIKTISVSTIAKAFVFCVVTSVLFVSVFSSYFFKKTKFIVRLSCFTALFLPIEIVFLYWVRLFTGKGTTAQWIIFAGIIVVLYVSSLVIDCTVNKKLGEAYTSQLKNYKEGLTHE